MLQTYFATPELLWTLLAVPAAFAFFVFGYFRRKACTAQLSSPLPLRRSLLVRPRTRRWKALFLLIGVSLTAIAAAGPQWGLDQDAQFRKGRDVIVVLDLSRSMFAEQPSRRDLALDALKHLADTLEQQGGNRVALVGFASEARLFFPFTQDCNHLRQTLEEIRNDDYAKLTEKEPVSGTRIGAGLSFALASCDFERVQRPVIVLLSDGDDPAEDDEWRTGADQARERGVPVHVVAIGNPAKSETIPAGRELLEFEGEIVRSKLNEPRLRKIAESTGGAYWPAYRQAFPLGTFLSNVLESEVVGEADALARLPVFQLRYAWFLLPAAFFFLLSILLSDGHRTEVRRPALIARSKARSLTLVAVAILCISAADPPAVESLARQADEAFAADNFDRAVNLYEKAEALTQDPGRLAFNKAASYYRLERYREAIESYRRCLEDDQAPLERRSRAWFQLGNALVQQAEDDATQLSEAVDAYRNALKLCADRSSLRSDARHNLELAQTLLIKAREKHVENKLLPKVKPEKSKNDTETKGSKEQKFVLVPVDGMKGEKSKDAANGPSGKKSEQLQLGAIHVLPDTSKVAAISPEQTLATLAQEAIRIRAERRRQQNPPHASQISTKDW